MSKSDTNIETHRNEVAESLDWNLIDLESERSLRAVDRIIELEASNDRLSRQLIGMTDRLQESARQIKADGWDEGYDTGYIHGTAMVRTDSNPYRSES